MCESSWGTTLVGLQAGALNSTVGYVHRSPLLGGLHARVWVDDAGGASFALELETESRNDKIRVMNWCSLSTT